jgi:DNA-binding MarR family transcriptional regulator
MVTTMPKTNDASTTRRDGIDETLLEQIHSLMHQYRRRQYQALRDAPESVTHMESKVLSFFIGHPGAKPSDLAAHSGRDKGQLTRLIAGLRERGLLEAVADESDRRVLCLHATRSGIAAMQAVRKQGRRLAAVAVKGLTDTEQRQLSSLLSRMGQNLESLPQE